MFRVTVLEHAVFCQFSGKKEHTKKERCYRVSYKIRV